MASSSSYLAASGLTASPRFESLFNFRDLGGHPTAAGTITRFGHVYRSDGLHRCTTSDVARLEALNVTRVVDLRTVLERSDDGHFGTLTKAIDYRHVPILDIVGENAAKPSRHTEPLVSSYLAMVIDRRGRIVEAIRSIATAPGPVVFHCTAGKDRTGVVAALLLAAVGVPDGRIVADYAQSAAAMDSLVEWYREHRSGSMLMVPARDDRRRRMMDADPSWIQHVLDHVREDHGTIRRSLLEAGATLNLLDDLYAKLVD